MVSAAKAAADEMVSEAMAEADTAIDDAMARAAAAEAELDAMKMAMHQPSAVQVAFSQLDAGLADFSSAQVSLAGPDAIYVSNIMYGGQPYSALLKYEGGTSATVQYVFGPVGKLIPDSVDLSQTTVAFESPDSFSVSNVGVGGAGYSGTLQYTGDGQLQVTGLNGVNLPTKPEVLLADAQAELATAMSEMAAQKQALDEANADGEAARLALTAANNALAAANSELDAATDSLAAAQRRAMDLETEVAALITEMAVLIDGSSLPGLNAGLLDLEAASLTAAGPNEVYIAGIQYAGAPVSARIKYDAGTATATALFEGRNLVADSLQLDAAQPSLQDNKLVISNVGIEGRAHTLTLTRGDDGQVAVDAVDDGWEVRTRGELARDNLIRSGNFVVNGFGGGQALPGEGSWESRGGSVVQSDTDATHAKYSIAADQSADELLFGFSANANGGDKVGFGLHILASATPQSGNTWNYGKSYLLWVTQDPFYDSEELHLQFYESGGRQHADVAGEQQDPAWPFLDDQRGGTLPRHRYDHAAGQRRGAAHRQRRHRGIRRRHDRAAHPWRSGGVHSGVRSRAVSNRLGRRLSSARSLDFRENAPVFFWGLPNRKRWQRGRFGLTPTVTMCHSSTRAARETKVQAYRGRSRSARSPLAYSLKRIDGPFGNCSLTTNLHARRQIRR